MQRKGPKKLLIGWLCLGFGHFFGNAITSANPSGVPSDSALGILGSEYGWTSRVSCAPDSPPDENQLRQWRLAQPDPTRTLWLYLDDRKTQVWCGIGIESDLCEFARNFSIRASGCSEAALESLASYLRNGLEHQDFSIDKSLDSSVVSKSLASRQLTRSDFFFALRPWLLGVFACISLLSLYFLLRWYAQAPVLFDAIVRVKRPVSFREWIIWNLRIFQQRLSARRGGVPKFHTGGGSIGTEYHSRKGS